MHVTLINASPRNLSKSHTAQITKAFQNGLESKGIISELYHLSERQNWDEIISVCKRSENIIIAAPVYIETVPGSFIEFLERLAPFLSINQTLSFIIQSAFPEASQRRCCEMFLKNAVEQMKCNFGGILSCGNFFQFPMIEDLKKKKLNDFEMFGVQYAEHNFCFFFEEAEQYTSKEELTEKDAKTYVRIVNFFFRHISEAQGCQVSLSDRPYQPIRKDDE